MSYLLKLLEQQIMKNLTKIDRYIIKEKCGSGGMSTVYLATDPELEMDVAIKILAGGDLERNDLKERFRQEAQVLALLQHPAIVPILNFGEIDNNLYFVMPYLPGGSLRERLNDGPLSLEETIEIVQRVASALEAAHEKRIIHRDVKPHNILFDEHGQAFLADFGVARLMDQDEAEQTVTLIGTPEFMSPEQVLEGSLTPRTDSYQLGVVIFQMLTGWLPFEGSAHHVMTQHLHTPVPSVLVHNPTLPAACDAVIQKAMAKEPHDRFPTAVSLSLALAQILTVEPDHIVINVASSDDFETVAKRPFFSKASLLLSVAGIVMLFGLMLPQVVDFGSADDGQIANDNAPSAFVPADEVPGEAAPIEVVPLNAAVPVTEEVSPADIEQPLVEENNNEEGQDETAVANNTSAPENTNPPPPPPPNNNGNGNNGGGGNGNNNGGANAGNNGGNGNRGNGPGQNGNGNR